MPNTDNPLTGTGLSEAEATAAIGNILNPQGQSEAEAAPVEDNPEGQKRAEDGKFAAKEPDAPADDAETDMEAEEGQGEEDATPDAEMEAQEADPEDSELVDMPETLDGLAELLELDAQALKDMKVTVKEDGKSRDIPLAEALDGYQRLEDYRSKTADVAEAKKAFRAEQDAVAAERKHYAEQLGPMVQQMQARLAQDDAKLVKMLDPDSSAYDPEGYVREKARLDTERAQATVAQAEADRIAQQTNAENHQRFMAEVAEHEQALIAANPSWGKDAVKAKKDLDEIRSYVVSQGAPKELVDNEFRSYTLLLAQKAMLYDKQQQRKPEVTKKVRKLPKTVKSGPQRERVDPNVKQHQVNLSRLGKSGSVKDAAAVFKSGNYSR